MTAQQASLFGHPPGLYYLAFTETWERFSYYGMTAVPMLEGPPIFPVLPGYAMPSAGFE